MSDRSPVREALRTALAKHPKIHAWQIRTVDRRGHQSYLVGTTLENERTTTGESHEVAVFVEHGDLLGRAMITVDPSEAGRLDDRIERAVFMAGLGGDARWTLPGKAEPTRVELYDAALDGARVRGTSKVLIDAWRSAIAAERGVQPSSMELFCATEATTFENSAGAAVESTATRVSLLTIVLAAEGGSAESVSWEERRRAADLDVRAIVGRAAGEARDLTRAQMPPTGNYPVVIDAKEMGALFSPFQANASAETVYRKSSRFEIGKPLPIEGTGGEPLVLVSNAIAPYGLSSYVVDADGVPGRRVEIVKDGVFARPWATKQFADYLGAEPTGGFGNLEIPPGSTSLADLTSGERVLHVRAFSWLTPDQSRGNFGTEIRVGSLHERGGRTPVKGGTVSGSLFKVLGSARFASEPVFLGGYLGAAGVRLEGLSVTGR